MYQSLYTRLVQMPNIARCLTGFLTSHDGVRVDRSERINDDFTTNRLDRINDDGDGTGVELFE